MHSSDPDRISRRPGMGWTIQWLRGAKRRPPTSLTEHGADRAPCCRSCMRAGSVRLCAGRGRAAGRRGAEPVPRRGAWRGHLLPRLPPRAGRAPRAEALPRRSLPGDGRRRAGRAGAEALGLDWRGTTADGAADRWSRSIASACAPARPRRMLDGEPMGAARRRARSTRSRGGRRDDAAHLRPARCRAPSPSAPTRSRPRSPIEAAGAALRRRDRAQRLARPVLAGAAGRGRDAEGRIAYGPVTATDVPGLFAAGLLERRAIPAASAGPRTSVPQAPDPPHLRPLRHHRSAVARRLRAHGGWRGLERAPRARRRRHRRRGDQVGPARPRRRRLPDRHQVEDGRRHAGRRRSTSSATPTRATAAPSPTA